MSIDEFKNGGSQRENVVYDMACELGLMSKICQMANIVIVAKKWISLGWHTSDDSFQEKNILRRSCDETKCQKFGNGSV